MTLARSRLIAVVAAALTASLVGTPLKSQVVDHQIPLNYNFHGMAHTSEAVGSAPAANAELVKYRSIADRGLFIDAGDPHAAGTATLNGATGITYGLYSVAGYSNATHPSAAADELDMVFLGNRVLNNALEVFVNPNTSQGVFPTWAPLATIIGFSGNAGAVTATTSAAHGFAIGNAVLISGATPALFNGTYTVTAVPDATHFTFDDPNTTSAAAQMYANNLTVPSMTLSGTTLTVNTSTAHGFAAGQAGIVLSGVLASGGMPQGYNGTYSVLAVNNATQFTVDVTNGATGTASARMYLNGSIQVTALVGDISSTVSATTAVAHGLSVSDSINISGANVLSFNGTFTVATVPDSTHFTYTAAPFGTMRANGIALSSLSGNGTTVTGQTPVNHLFTAGNNVVISNVTPGSYNGTYTILATPTATTFTYTNATTGSATGSYVAAGACDRSTTDQVTTLSSPITVDSTTEVGVLYLVSNGPGGGAPSSQFDAVLTFNNGSSDTHVAARLHAADWFGNPAEGSVPISPVASLKKVPHGASPINVTSLVGNGTVATVTTDVAHGLGAGATVVIAGATEGGFNGIFNILAAPPPAGTTFSISHPMNIAASGTITATPVYTTFRAVQSNDSANLQPFGTNNGGPNLNLTEAVISVRKIIDSGTNVAGQNLTKITFKNALWAGTTVTGLTAGPGTVTATVGSTAGFIPGQPITIAGFSPAAYNGNYTIKAVLSSTTFTFDTTASGVPSTTGQMYANNVAVSGIAAASPGGGSARVTTTAAHGFTVGQTVVISGAGTTQGFNGTYTITGVPSSTTFLIATTQGGTATGTRQVQRVGVGRGYSIYAATARTGTTSNSSCAAAQIVSTGDTAGSNFHGTSAASTCGGGNDLTSAWYQFTAGGAVPHLVEARTCQDAGAMPQMTGVTGVSTISAADSNVVLPLDTTLEVFTGGCGSLTSVACNDNACSVSSRVPWMATPGTTYRIRVGGKNNATGRFTLHIDDPAHVDLTMPLQFNWNGICHGTVFPTPPGDSEQTIPDGITGPPAGVDHENRCDFNGFRAIADRGLLFDPNANTPNALNFGGTVGYRGIKYEVYTTALQSDMVHLGNRNLAAGGIRQWNTTPDCPAIQTVPIDLRNNGRQPLWLNNDDQTGPQTSSMTGLNAVFGADTRIGLLYHISNVDTVVAGVVPTIPRNASFDVTLAFADTATVTVTVRGIDWFGGASANPYNQLLPTANPDSGVEAQRILGIYHGVLNTDRGTDDGPAGQLKVEEAIISTASLLAMTVPFDPTVHGALTSITFGNLQSGNGVPDDHIYSAAGIYAATIRDPSSFNLNYGPSGVGTVTPNQLVIGNTGKMVVTVSRGSGSPNNITSVVVDGSAVGLSSTLALNDSGADGDVTPNDDKWSRNVSFPVNTTTGPYQLPFVVTDAQARTGAGNIIFTIAGPNAQITPTSVVVGSEPKITVNMSSNGTATPFISSVTVDASSLGLSSVFALNDAGNNGDTAANDGTYSAMIRIPLPTFAGPYTLPFTVTDTATNTFNGNLPTLTVNQPVGAIAPSQAFEGITCKYTVNLVLNGIKSTNITSVTADLSPINLSNAVALNDSGNSGDVSANDGIWSVDFVVPVGAPAGQTSLPFTIMDSLAGSTAGAVNFTVSVLNDLGVLPTGMTTVNDTQNPGDVHWYRFTLANSQGVNDFLDIDTEGTIWTATNDTHVALYASTGTVFLNGATPAIDDDDGTNFLSQLTFGNSTVPRSPPGNGLAYDGRDGILTAGTYYLAVTGFAATFNAGFNVTTNSTQSGSTVVRLALGTVPAGGPPGTFFDLGILGETPITDVRPLSPGGVVWFRFVLATPVDGATPTPREFLDIDSEGSQIFDTMIALFRDDGSGTLVTVDDNDGSSNLSQLSYGRGTRDPVADSLPYNGRDGLTLVAGTYYLAVTEYAATFGNNFIVFFNTGTSTGDVTVNLRRGVQPLIVCGPINNPANNHNYYLLDTDLSATQAEAFAVTLGGHLVTINDGDENSWVQFNVLLCNNAVDRRAFIGLNDVAVEAAYEWFNGEPVTYTNWNGGEPNNGGAGGNEDYAEMLGNSLWNDIGVAATATRFALVEVGVSPIGDMDCNSVVDFLDVQAFVLALIDPSGYGIQYPGCPILNGDVNNDTLVNGRDIDPFTQLVIP